MCTPPRTTPTTPRPSRHRARPATAAATPPGRCSQQVIEILGHTNVRVVPVLDLADQHPVDAYEVPTTLAEALHLLSPACASPWSSNLTRTKDSDHVIPYHPPDQGGPPGQTRLDNLAPLHRYRVDRHGTHPLGRTDSHTERRAQEHD
jgi:hypothetical protein